MVAKHDRIRIFNPTSTLRKDCQESIMQKLYLQDSAQAIQRIWPRDCRQQQRDVR